MEGGGDDWGFTFCMNCSFTPQTWRALLKGNYVWTHRALWTACTELPLQTTCPPLAPSCSTDTNNTHDKMLIGREFLFVLVCLVCRRAETHLSSRKSTDDVSCYDNIQSKEFWFGIVSFEVSAPVLVLSVWVRGFVNSSERCGAVWGTRDVVRRQQVHAGGLKTTRG